MCIFVMEIGVVQSHLLQHFEFPFLAFLAALVLATLLNGDAFMGSPPQIDRYGNIHK